MQKLHNRIQGTNFNIKLVIHPIDEVDISVYELVDELGGRVELVYRSNTESLGAAIANVEMYLDTRL